MLALIVAAHTPLRMALPCGAHSLPFPLTYICFSTCQAGEFAKLYSNLKQHGYPMGTIAEARKALDQNDDSRIELREYCQWLTDIKYGRVAAL